MTARHVNLTKTEGSKAVRAPKAGKAQKVGYSEEWDWLARDRASRETSLKFVPPAYSSELSLVQTNSDTRTTLQQ